MTRARQVAASTLVLVAVTAVGAGCTESAPEPGPRATTWVLGTTESATSTDPAGSYDVASWNIQYEVFEQLLAIPSGGGAPVGDAAESCDFDDAVTLTCRLRSGLVFSNEHALTSSDVAFSLRRTTTIAAPNGPAALLAPISTVDTPDPLTVVLHLRVPDSSVPAVLATAAASIVDEETFPADALLDDARVVGSGPYVLTDYRAGEQAEFRPSPSYDGPRPPGRDSVLLRFYRDPDDLAGAVDADDVDVAWRTLRPSSHEAFRGDDDLAVSTGPGADLRYWAFDLATPTGRQLAVRRAAALVVDREAVAAQAYGGAVTPTDSLLPPGWSDGDPAGPGPDPEAAAAVLAEAGVATPVPLRLGYTPTYYGPGSAQEAETLAAQLRDSGLFEVTVSSAELTEYQQQATAGAFDLYQLGSAPVVVDPVAYLDPVLGGIDGSDPGLSDLRELLEALRSEPDDTRRTDLVQQVESAVASEVPVIPVWRAQSVAVTSSRMSGVEDTLDESTILRFWEVSASG